MVEEKINIEDHEVVLKTLNYGDFKMARDIAESKGWPVNDTVFCTGIVSWDFTDPVTGELLPIEPTSLQKIEPFGYVTAMMAKFSQMNYLGEDERKKLSGLLADR